MHEVAITQQLVEIAQNQAANHGANKVTSVTVEIGALSGVIAQAVEFCYDSCTQGTILEGSELKIIATEASGWCSDCQQRCQIDATTLACMVCQGFMIKAEQGMELRLVEIDVI